MKSLKGKRLLILGGGKLSCEIVEHARNMGVTTGVVDWYPIEKSPAKLIADEAYVESTADIDSIVNLIKTHKFDGVITGFTDSVLPYYARICKKAGLPCYGTEAQFETFIDKKKYKDLLRKHNVPTIPEYKISSSNLNEIAETIMYPVIVKPTDGSGSRGITVCHNRSQLEEAITTAVNSSKDKEIIVEEYIDGEEVTLFWIFNDGEYHLSLAGNRHVKNYQDSSLLPLPVGYTYPTAILPSFLKDTAPSMKNMFKDCGIKNGMMFMQCKVKDNKCLVYDIGFRLTGSLEYINIKQECRYDPLDMLINFALTGNMGEKDLESIADPFLGGKYSYNVSILCKPGIIKEITGIDKVRDIPGVSHVFTSYALGDEITPEMKGRLAQITVRVIGSAPTIEAMQKNMQMIENTVRVYSDKGELMNLPGITDKDFNLVHRHEQ